MVPAPCASGKTYAACRHIASPQQRRFNWMYVAPSILLLEQTKEELESLGIEVDMITSDTQPDGAVATIIRYINGAESSGHVLLIAWAGYQMLPYFNHNNYWRIIVDEVPQVDQFYEINLQQHIDELLGYIQLGETVNETVSTVIPVDKGKLKRLLEKPDDLTKVLQPLFSKVLSDKADVFVDIQSWTQMAERCKSSKKLESNRIYFMSMLNPRLFNHATLLGANIQDSILYHWFTQFHGVRFLKNQRIISGLRFTEHPSLGHRLKIQYLLKDKGYSKHLANKKLKDSEHRWIDGLDEAALKAIDGRPFIYAVNHDYRGKLDSVDHGQKIPTVSHGLNCYQDQKLIYFAPSLNRSPQHLRMLNHLGIDNVTIKNSTLHEVAYQALMRTSLRNPDSDEVVECIVPEYETAARLASLFGEADMKWIGDDRFEKKKAMTGTERNKKSRAKKKQEKRLSPHFRDGSPIEDSKEKSHYKMALDEWKITFQPMYAVTYHATKYDTDEEDFYLDFFEPQEFVRDMRSDHQQIIENKEDNYLMNPTVFDKGNTEEGLRKQEFFFQSSMMMLDFDNGDLSIDDFIRMFWSDAGRGNKRSFIIFNSFSRSSEQPNRFRVCLLYKEPATSLEAHQAVYDSIVMRLERDGYSENSSALDRQCRTGNQSFYLPCINAAERDWAFFEAYGRSTREIERHGIVPDQYLRTSLSKVPTKAMVVSLTGTSDVQPEMSIDEWKSKIRSMAEGRNAILFEFGLSLTVHHKLPRDQVLDHLEDVAAGDAVLESKVMGVMNSLEKHGHWQKAA